MRLFVLMLAAGCVSKSKHELLEIQLDATRAAVAARSQQQAEETRTLETQLTELRDELILRKAELDMLRLRQALSDDALARAREQIQLLTAEIDRLEAMQKGDPLPAETRIPPSPVDVEAGVLHARVATLSEALAPLGDRGRVRVEDTSVVVTIPLSQLVQEGWTTLSPRGEVLTGELAQALAVLPGAPVEIRGHTDAVPKHSATYPSNWERGFGAALVVLRALDAAEVPMALTASSAADHQLLPDLGAEDEDQNRVEVWVQLAPEAQQSFEGLPDEE